MRRTGLHSDFIQKIPRPSREVIFETIRESEQARAKNAKPEDFIDDQIVRDLEREGYFPSEAKMISTAIGVRGRSSPLWKR